MSIDAEVVLLMAPVFNMLWSAPLQVPQPYIYI